MPRKPAKKKPAKAGAPSGVPAAHGRYDYSPIVDRPPLRWPNGARVALWVIPNIEHFLFDRPATKISGDRKSTRLNSSHIQKSRMPSSA